MSVSSRPRPGPSPPPTVVQAGLSVHTTPQARAQYYHTHGVGGGWPDVPLGSRSASASSSSAGAGGLGRQSPASFGFPTILSPASGVGSPAGALSPDEAAQAQLTPSEVREEREYERTRRRMALRKKAERARSSRAGGGTGSGSSLPGSPAPELIGLGGSVTPRMTLPSGNDLLHVHPSMQHAAAFGMQSSRFGRGGSAVMNNRFDASSTSSASLAASPPYARAAFPHSLSSPGLDSIRRSISDGPNNTQLHPSSSNAGSPLQGGHQSSHLIDMPSEPEDDSTLLERVNAGFWTRVKSWDSTQRQNSLRWSANVNGALGLAYFIVCLSVFSTSFSSPSLHWTCASVALFTILMGYFLRFIVARRMDLFLMLMWLVFGSIQVGGMLILSILLFHTNKVGMDFNMRQEWNQSGSTNGTGTDNGGTGGSSIDLDQKQQEYHERFEELRDECVLHLKILGATTITVMCCIFTLLCIVGTIRNHILSEEDFSAEFSNRQKVYQQRLKNRQRMARLGAQMKERRRLRKIRGRASSSTYIQGGSMFTGVGSNPGGANSWSDHSIPDDHSATVGGGNVAATQSSIPMSVLSSSSSTRPEPSSSPLLPQDSDESRFAGMESDAIEEELERVEQKREQREQQQQLEERKETL